MARQRLLCILLILCVGLAGCGKEIKTTIKASAYRPLVHSQTINTQKKSAVVICPVKSRSGCPPTIWIEESDGFWEKIIGTVSTVTYWDKQTLVQFQDGVTLLIDGSGLAGGYVNVPPGFKVRICGGTYEKKSHKFEADSVSVEVL